MALRSMRAQPLAHALTLLGIVIGVGAVVAMLAIGDGAARQACSSTSRRWAPTCWSSGRAAPACAAGGDASRR